MHLVFTRKTGTPVRPWHPNQVMKRILKKARIRNRRFHDQRHTVGTLLMTQGVNAKIVAELLGHSSVTITLDVYSHVSPTMQRDAVARINKVLGWTS